MSDCKARMHQIRFPLHTAGELERKGMGLGDEMEWGWVGKEKGG